MLPDVFPSEEKANNILQDSVSSHFTKIKSFCSSFYFLCSLIKVKKTKKILPEVEI